MSDPAKVLVAGIGGASLGTELLKCLRLAGRYRVFGCDISPLAFGHYQEGCEKTFCVDRQRYLESVLEVCLSVGVKFLIPGGEEPMRLLGEAREELTTAGVRLAMNSPEVVHTCSDKEQTVEALRAHGFDLPLTLRPQGSEDLEAMTFPCVVKPSRDSGGSSFVFVADDAHDARLYLHYLAKNGKRALVQEYLPEDEGEFTIGVLSLPDGRVASSIALKRCFPCKLSVQLRTRSVLISSGYSQGIIDDFPEHRATAERIARALGSTGPLNIQGRVRAGVLVPFEINPRFSASSYLRALAGRNEVDIYLQYLATGRLEPLPSVKAGYYLRSLSETYVSRDELRACQGR